MSVSCGVCGKKFKSVSGLADHKKATGHEGEEKKPEAEKNEEEEAVKRTEQGQQEEEEKRNKAKGDNKEAEEEEEKKAEDEAVAKKKAEDEAVAKKKAEEEAVAKKKAEEEAVAKKEEAVAKKKAEDEAVAKKKAEDEAVAKKKAEEETVAKKKAEEEAVAKKESAVPAVPDTNPFASPAVPDTNPFASPAVPDTKRFAKAASGVPVETNPFASKGKEETDQFHPPPRVEDDDVVTDEAKCTLCGGLVGLEDALLHVCIGEVQYYKSLATEPPVLTSALSSPPRLHFIASNDVEDVVSQFRASADLLRKPCVLAVAGRAGLALQAVRKLGPVVGFRSSFVCAVYRKGGLVCSDNFHLGLSWAATISDSCVICFDAGIAPDVVVSAIQQLLSSVR